MVEEEEEGHAHDDVDETEEAKEHGHVDLTSIDDSERVGKYPFQSNTAEKTWAL